MEIYDLPKKIVELTNINQPSGKPHTRSGFFNATWLFDNSGRYAAIVEPSFVSPESRMNTLTIYDCLHKEAYEYMNITIEITVCWFYWFGEFLVIAGKNEKTNLLVFELNHVKKNARLVHVRQVSDIYPGYSTTTQCIVSLDKYFPLYDTYAKSVFLLPKDPFSVESPKKFMINCPYTGYEDQINELAGTYSLYREVMSFGSTLYFFKVMETADNYVFRLDCLIKIDLTKLLDVYGKSAKEIRRMGKQDLTSYSLIRLKMPGAPDETQFHFFGHASFGSRLHSSTDGFLHFVNFFPADIQLPYNYFVMNLRTMEIVPFWKITLHPASPCEYFHPSGQMPIIYYGEDEKLKCKMFWRMNNTTRSLKEIAKQRLFFGEKQENLKNYDSFVNRFL